MTRLQTVKPRLGGLSHRMGASPADEKERSRQRDASNDWRAWYKTARWQRLKERVHIRDLYTCQRTGVLVIGKYPAPNSAVANHKIPHRGDPELFWDEDNIETVSKAYHDREIQKAEQSAIKGVWY